MTTETVRRFTDRTAAGGKVDLHFDSTEEMAAFTRNADTAPALLTALEAIAAWDTAASARTGNYERSVPMGEMARIARAAIEAARG